MPGESVDDVVALLNVAEDHVSEALRAVRQALLDAAEVTRVVANVGLIDKSRQLDASLSHVTGADDTLEKLGEDLRNAIEGFVMARGHESGEPGRLDFGSLYRPRADAFAFSSRTVAPSDELTPLDPTEGRVDLTGPGVGRSALDDDYDDAGSGAGESVDFSSVKFDPDAFDNSAFDSPEFDSGHVDSGEIPAGDDDEVAVAESVDRPDESAPDELAPVEAIADDSSEEPAAEAPESESSDPDSAGDPPQDA